MEETTFEQGGIVYRILPDKSDEVEVVGYNKSIANVLIPTKILYNGKHKTVTSIGYDMFQNGGENWSYIWHSIGGGPIIRDIEDAMSFASLNRDLLSVTIPSSVILIDSGAFSHCENLKSIYCKSIEPPTLSEWALGEDQLKQCILYVPKGAKESYETAKGWSEFANIEEFDS